MISIIDNERLSTSDTTYCIYHIVSVQICDWQMGRRMQDTDLMQDGDLDFDSQASILLRSMSQYVTSAIDIVRKIKVKYIVHNTDRVGCKNTKKIDAYCQCYRFSIIDCVGSPLVIYELRNDCTQENQSL